MPGRGWIITASEEVALLKSMMLISSEVAAEYSINMCPRRNLLNWNVSLQGQVALFATVGLQVKVEQNVSSSFSLTSQIAPPPTPTLFHRLIAPFEHTQIAILPF